MQILFFVLFLNGFISFSLCKESLDQIALRTGTDKSSRFHHYTPIYERYFDLVRDEPIRFLEIGFYQGASARLWDNYFSKAEIYLIDLDRTGYNYMRGLSNRCHLDMIDQQNAAQLKTYAERIGGFDIILDDGGHTMMQQITSFETLFPFVHSGGIYIIEDLHTSYRSEQYGGVDVVQPYNSSSKTTVNFLKNLIDDLNTIGARTFCADQKKCHTQLLKTLSLYQREIESIHFYSSIVFIFKK